MALLLVFFLKRFAFDVIKVNANDMLDTFKQGDALFIKKFANNYHLNDFIYFKYPEADGSNDIQCLQRLIARPGDSIELKDKQLFINGTLLSDTNTTRYNYFIKTSQKPDSSFFTRYHLHEGGQVAGEDDYSFTLTKSQADTLKHSSHVKSLEIKIEKPGVFDETVFPYSTAYPWNTDNFGKLYLPKKNDTLLLDSLNINIYSKLISVYENNKLFIKQDSIFINDIPVKNYIVKQNYYFVMGDNRDNANDSRIFGFLPENFIIGKVLFTVKKQK